MNVTFYQLLRKALIAPTKQCFPRELDKVLSVPSYTSDALAYGCLRLS
jgi:hypothetical protein